MYDANLVFGENFPVDTLTASVLSQVGGSIDLESARTTEGLTGMYLEIEVLETPVGSALLNGFDFSLVASDTEGGAGSTGVTVASSPNFGAATHKNGAMPVAGEKYLIPVNSAVAKTGTSYARRYLTLWFVNTVAGAAAYAAAVAGTVNQGAGAAVTAAGFGFLTAGRFRLSLRCGNPGSTTQYPGGY